MWCVISGTRIPAAGDTSVWIDCSLWPLSTSRSEPTNKKEYMERWIIYEKVTQCFDIISELKNAIVKVDYRKAEDVLNRKTLHIRRGIRNRTSHFETVYELWKMRHGLSCFMWWSQENCTLWAWDWYDDFRINAERKIFDIVAKSYRLFISFVWTSGGEKT